MNTDLMKHFLILACLNLFLNLTAQDPGDAAFEEAKMLYNAGEYGMAIVLLDSLVDAYPNYFLAYFKKSYANYNLGEYQKALYAIDKAYRVKRFDNKYFYMKAQFYDKMKKPELALYYLDLANQMEKSNPAYLNYRAILYLEEGEYSKAINDLNQILYQNPKRYKLYYPRGLAKYNIKQREEACLDWVHAMEQDENSKRMYFYRCTDLDLRGKSIKQVLPNDITPPMFSHKDELTFMEFINRHVEYSDEALYNQEEGTVLVKFTIDETGNVVSDKIVRGATPVLDSIAIAIVKSSNGHWSSAFKNGRATSYEFITPVTFQIEDGEYYRNLDLEEQLQKISSKNADSAIIVANQILKFNPFNYEVFLLKEKLMEKAGKAFSDTINWFDILRYGCDQVLFETRSENKYVKMYYDKIWQLTDKKHAFFYRICNWNFRVAKVIGNFYDFYMDGSLYAKGVYEFGYKHGRFFLYHPNGKLKTEMTYKNNMVNGRLTNYYNNGIIHHSFMAKPYSFTINEYNDSTGSSLLDFGSGDWLYEFWNYDHTVKVKLFGKLKDYKMHGEWNLYFSDNLVLREMYSNGKFLSGLYRKDNQEVAQSKTNIGTWIITPYCFGLVEKSEHSDKLPENYYFFLSNPSGYQIMHYKKDKSRMNIQIP